MSPLQEIARAILLLLRMTVFGLALGLTVISFQAYNQRRTDRLEAAFIGFAFISMGVALTSISSQVSTWRVGFEIAETVPFIVGFGMLYASLYR
ncbi:MAG: hypothetical protein ABEJ22_06785 [Haloferacaceae archaeon]